ncbi:hypothetical protein ACLI4Z_15365 [Natrialbaceae archaeon A-arb3/5]
MYRRRVISAVSTVSICAVAGCLRTDCLGGRDVSLDPVDTDEVAERVSTSNLDETSPMVADLLLRSIDGDEPEVETISQFPLDQFTYVERDGRFYEVNEEVVADGSVTGPEYELTRDSETADTVSADDAVSFADLPSHDQWRVAAATEFSLDHGKSESVSTSFVAGYLDADDHAASALTDVVDESALNVDGHVFELEHVGEGTTPAWRLRHTADLVAEDAGGLADHVLELRGTVLSDPSDDVQKLFDEAQENGGSVTVCNHDVIGEDDVAAERRRNAVSELRGVNDHVRYEGEWYQISISGWAV